MTAAARPGSGACGTRSSGDVPKAAVSHVSGRIFAQVYWLTTKDNVQAQRLYNRIANLTPFVKYQV
jgi:hypothetical protein